MHQLFAAAPSARRTAIGAATSYSRIASRRTLHTTAVAAAAESPATFSAALATTTRLTAAAFAALARCTATLTPTAQSADGPHRFHRGVRVPLRRSTGSSTAALAAAARTAAHATTTSASLASTAAAQPATEHSALLARGLRLFRSLQCEGLRGR